MTGFDLPGFDLAAFIEATLAEDLGGVADASRDLTANACLAPDARLSAVLDSRDAVVVAGLPIAAAFFRRLEDKHGIAGKIPRLGQVTRRAHQHGGMAVMAAAVHQARLGRHPAKFVVFKHGQRIHVGAQTDHGPEVRLHG